MTLYNEHKVKDGIQCTSTTQTGTDLCKIKAHIIYSVAIDLPQPTIPSACSGKPISKQRKLCLHKVCVHGY